MPALVALVGPTAVGKTALGIQLAQRLRGEIISADSRQVYRLMSIGTAQPTRDELAAVPHHLIGFLHPDDDFSLAMYQQLARATIAAIVERGNLPLLVGGTGQYLAALLEGWQVPPVPPQPELRAELEQYAHKHGAAALYLRLEQVDPQAAATIGRENVRRMVRALEVFHMTGVPISQQQTRHPPPYHITTLWLDMPRAQLYARIDQRIDGMMAAGLLDEVHALLRHGYGWHLSSMSSLGYIQFRPYFEGSAPLEACVQQLKYDTHAFARRQASWFRRLPGLVRVAV
ncbi:MAG: tRNA (adenosine(37)-N6)-dimethylallyltransferase MiaA [Chloroflexaceae bacterium]|nr:tRNA (adenosine(37)-N6)-dimethylallyltransferase MiaA [Chloroflexaceae bacterium]